MIKPINYSLLICLFLLFYSCRDRPHDFDFKVVNNTNYKIETMKLGCGEKNSMNISIEPNGLVTFIYHYSGTYFNFTEPLLCHTITKYSDTTTSYKNTIGGVISFHALSKNNLNIINIELDPDPFHPSNIFSVSLQ